MKVAIPTWNGRISPVFDVAERVVVADVEGGEETSRAEALVGGTPPQVRAARLAELGVNVLICGALSRPLEAMLQAKGVRVIPQMCGLVDEVLQAFTTGQLTEQAFLMPGCCGRRRRSHARRRRNGPTQEQPGGA